MKLDARRAGTVLVKDTYARRIQDSDPSFLNERNGTLSLSAFRFWQSGSGRVTAPPAATRHD